MTLDLCGFCRNLEEAVSLLQILLGSLKKRERERRHLCESVYILWASMSIHVTHVCRMQLLVHPPTSLLTLDLCGFCRNLEEAVSLLQILLGSLKKRERERRHLCESVYIYSRSSEPATVSQSETRLVIFGFQDTFLSKDLQERCPLPWTSTGSKMVGLVGPRFPKKNTQHA